jgi:hypothetical protein
MNLLLSSLYAGNIDYYCALSKASNVTIDTYHNFQKQSYRNRCVIAGANGRLNLIIPVKRKSGKIPLNKVLIDNDQNWRKMHWKSLESAYRTSPYFEYYEHEFRSIFLVKSHDFLIDFNNDVLNITLKFLQIETTINYSHSYVDNDKEFLDLRDLIHPKKSPSEFYSRPEYTQVFQEKMEHLSNLSILDLLFNEGPMASNLLLK